ncbi:MAG: hypothetical protein LBS88_06885 [Tannerellaceae bacterium]|nr:hypothetical protein [Tannerellaceae bacterium]
MDFYRHCEVRSNPGCARSGLLHPPFRNDDANEELKKYRNLLAQRAGRHSKDATPEDGEE